MDKLYIDFLGSNICIFKSNVRRFVKLSIFLGGQLQILAYPDDEYLLFTLLFTVLMNLMNLGKI